MIKSRVIDVLVSLTKSELKELEDFIDSPFHNKNKNIRKLFKTLKKFYPSFTCKNLTKEFIYTSIFQDRKYADKTFRNLMSDLLDLAERYFAYCFISSSPNFEKYFRTKALSERGLVNLAESSFREADKIFRDFRFDGGDIFYIMHLNEMEKDLLAIRKNKLINLNMKDGEYLIYAFLSKYLIFKMKFYNYKYKLDTEKLSEFIEQFEKSVNIESFIKYFETVHSDYGNIILIYYYCTKFMNELSEDMYYHKVKKLLEKNKKRLSKTEIINIYLTFNGYCIAKMRSGDKNYEIELFRLYKEMIEEKLILGVGEDHLHITLFNNIIALGLRVNEHGWTKSFIDEYSSRLMPEYTETMHHYSYSQYHFSRKDFEKSLEFLNKINFETYYIKSGVRMLLLKIYFELGYTESFFSLSDSIKHYLIHDKMIPKDKREQDYNFVAHINKLYKYYLEPAAEKLDDIKSGISKKPSGTNETWLFEKIEELSRNK